MADLSIEFISSTENDDFVLDAFLYGISNRLQTLPYFTGKLFKHENSAFIHIKPQIFPFYYIGIIIWFAGFLLFGWLNKYVLVTGLIPFISYPFYNKYWYYIILYIALKRKGYGGKIKLL